MSLRRYTTVIGCAFLIAIATSVHSGSQPAGRQTDHLANGRHLFERETFGGNGRSCLTCHSRETGTVSPEEAQERFAKDPNDPLFLADGSDDGKGNGAARVLANATILVTLPLPPNVTLLSDATARFVTVRRGVPTTLNTPALDPVLMYDGRAPSLTEQARGAIVDHAGARRQATALELFRIAEFQLTRPFFSSDGLWQFAAHGRLPTLPEGKTDSERRGRAFFVDAPFAGGNSKAGLCAFCHSGPMLNETNEGIPVPPLRRGGRFQNVLVSELNAAGNPVIDLVFQNPNGTVKLVSSADPGRALVTGDATDEFESLNAFRIPTLWGAVNTSPYFHDNSARTLEDVTRHYARFFELVSGPEFDGDPPIIVTEQEQADIVAFLKLLR